MNETPHGQEGHVNVFIRDHDHYRTGYGSHDRVTCGLISPGQEDGGMLVVTVASHHALGRPSMAQIKKVIKEEGWGTRWELARSDYDGEYFFRRS